MIIIIVFTYIIRTQIIVLFVAIHLVIQQASCIPSCSHGHRNVMMHSYGGLPYSQTANMGMYSTGNMLPTAGFTGASPLSNMYGGVGVQGAGYSGVVATGGIGVPGAGLGGIPTAGGFPVQGAGYAGISTAGGLYGPNVVRPYTSCHGTVLM